jgi:hypothetical protein
MTENFYVYGHRTKTDGKCFYIGKGKGDRYKTFYSRNRHWHKIINHHGFEPVILVNNLSENKAFELEAYICEQIGYDNLINIRKEKGWGGHEHSLNTKLKLSKPVLQYDLEGNFLKKWNGATEAAQSLNKIHSAAITECCRGYRNSIYGYKWRFENNPIEESINFIPAKLKFPKPPAYYHPIEQYDLDGNFIQKWDNTRIAAKHLNINTASISNCLLGKYKTAGGFIWKKVLNKKGGYFA